MSQADLDITELSNILFFLKAPSIMTLSVSDSLSLSYPYKHAVAVTVFVSMSYYYINPLD